MTSGLKILWATDGSDCALAAVPMIRSLLLPVAASVQVLAVAPEPMLSGARLDPVYLKPRSAGERKAAQERALAVAQSAADELGADGVAVEAQARFGYPIQEILRAGDAAKADLIVLGAKGHSNLKLMLLGSVAQGVLQYAKRPVLLVRPGSASVSTAVVGIDGSKEALNALQFLQGLSLEPDALIVLTRAVQLIKITPAGSGYRTDAFSTEVERLNNEATRAALGDLSAANSALAGSGRSAVDEMPTGRAGEQLLKTAEKRNADLVVVGSRPPSRARKYLLGSTAEMVAREAASSVLLVR